MIRITENELRKLICESVRSILSEGYEVNEIGMIDYSCSFDEDGYKEWLDYNGLEDTQETLVQCYKEDIEYDLELFDSEYFYHMDYQRMYYDEMVDEYGEEIANEILKGCMEDGKGSLEPGYVVQNKNLDINNPEELDAEAMKLLKNGNYFKGARGYILHNGVVIYTESEHNMVSIIPNVEGTFHFIRLGNIRVLPNSIDMSAKPTPQQERTLMRVIRAYAQDVLYVDYMDTPKGDISKTYNNPNYEMIMRDINDIYR